MRARLIELGKLKDGWYDGHGKAPTRALLERTDAVLDLLTSLPGLGEPSLYPTPEGGLQAEWDLGLSVVVTPSIMGVVYDAYTDDADLIGAKTSDVLLRWVASITG